MATPDRATERPRGSVERLPSGSLRVRVYAGFDSLTGKRNYLTEVIPLSATPTKQAERDAKAEAKKALTRLLNQVDERRNPRTRATVNQLLDRHLEMLDVEATTRSTYEALIDRHIRPVIGTVQVARVDADLLDSYYHKLRTCQTHRNLYI